MQHARYASVKIWVTVGYESALSLRQSSKTRDPKQDFLAALDCHDAKVTVVLPGDIMCQPVNVWHTVCTGYIGSTLTQPDVECACILGGHEYLRGTQASLHAAYRNATNGLAATDYLRNKSVALYKECLLKPYWMLRGCRERYNGEAVLGQLRAELRESGWLSAQKQDAGMKRSRASVLRERKNAQLEEARKRRSTG